MMLATEYGNARKRNDGYYQITTKPHTGKLLHRLIYENTHGPIPEGCIIHHIDKDKENNSPENLAMMTKNEHHGLHHWGCGRIDEAGGIRFLSQEKNNGKNMTMVSEELGYTQPVPVHQYLRYRDLTWNDL